jgi:peptidoglycan/LPS O-acetylase OafA/YrhL
LISLFPNPVQKNSIAVLDGIRAIACLLVIVYHVNIQARFVQIWPGDQVGSAVTSLATMGWTGVTLFFILSGFLLFMPYAKALLLGSEWPSARMFYLRRVLRIFPGYYASLFLIILLAYPQYLQPAHWRELFLFLIFFMDSDTATFQRINGPFWTLAIEWQFYMLLPFLALGFRWLMNRFKLQWRLPVLISCLLLMIVWGIFTRYWGSYFFAHPDATLLVPRSVFNYVIFFLYGVSGKFFEDFAIGMLICVCYVYSRNASRDHWLRACLWRFSPWLWLAGLLLLLFMSLWPVFSALAFLQPYIDRHGWLVEIGFALGYGLCIMAVLFGPLQLKRPFEWKPLRWAGGISYSLYIWHLPIISVFMALVLPHIQDWHDGIVYGLLWLWVALIVFPFSYAFYRFFELPWMKKNSKLRAKEHRAEEVQPQTEKEKGYIAAGGN